MIEVDTLLCLSILLPETIIIRASRSQWKEKQNKDVSLKCSSSFLSSLFSLQTLEHDREAM